MQDAIERFLQYLHVERNASDLTIKSYREDLGLLVSAFDRRRRSCPPAGDDHDARFTRICRWLARRELRQNHDRPPIGIDAKFLSLWPARWLGEKQSSQAAAEPAQAARFAPFLVERRTWQAAGNAAERSANGAARSRNSGNAVFRRIARK